MDWRAKPEIVTRDGTPTGKKCISCGRIMGQACDCVSRFVHQQFTRLGAG